ncbi:MAG: hypothetical protein WBJ52_06405 [Methanoregulaceae archaeon]
MSPAVPRGIPIGRIEASLTWLLSHTTRFQGAIIVRISGGEGLILIEYGRPAAFLFNLGERTILGETAWRFFAQHDFLHASLHRYTDHEFQEAMTFVGPGAWIRERDKEASEAPPSMNLSEELQESGRIPQGTTTRGPVTVGPDPVKRESLGKTGRPPSAAAFAVPDRERSLEDVLGQLIEVPGVCATAFFRDGSIITSVGGRALEDLVEPAEEVLFSAFEVLPLLSPGPLVQVTILLFGSNITIVPYDDGYLLILTRPEINLGQIRKLVHEVAHAAAA